MKKAMKRKMLIAILAILGISAFGMTLLSYMSSAEDVQQTTFLASSNSGTGSKNTIDLIIENSNDATAEDSVYHIVEITSSTTKEDVDASGLRKMVRDSNAVFRKLVLDGHKTVENIFFNEDDSKLDYKVFTLDSPDSEVVAAIKKADFIYLSNDFNSKFEEGHDLSEDVKVALSSVVTGNYVPFMIDGHIKTYEGEAKKGNTFSVFATNVLRPEGSRYRSYSWTDSNDAAKFFNPNNLASAYVYVNGEYQAASGLWKTVTDADGNKLTCAKVLTIRSGADDTKLTTYLTSDLTGSKIEPDATATASDAIPEGVDVYKLGKTSAILGGYHPMKTTPGAVSFETIDISASTDLTGKDLSTYDFIILEGGIGGSPISDDMKNALTSAMMSNVHILYNASLKDTNSTVTIPTCTAKNYKYILDKVASANEQSKLNNVLVTTRSKVNAYASATRAKAVDAVAEIIINGSFRGMGGGSGSSTNLYTVLEIQPAYPIDLELAEKLDKIKDKKDPLASMQYNSGINEMTFIQGNFRENMRGDGSQNSKGARSFYYLRATGVSNQSIDEITYDGETSLAMMKDSQNQWGIIEDSTKTDNYKNVYDYYSWALTKAKIAYAKGLPVNEVNVVHMSSAEFNTSKATLLDNYDCIYIGGDYSSIKTDHYWEAGHRNMNYYKMYFHDGDVYDKGTDIDGFSDKSKTGVMLGNDLTTDKKKQLVEYVEAGMPLVVDKQLADAYAEVDVDGQTLLDPTSNMRAFLDKAKKGSEVIWGFDDKQTMKIDNSDGTYGNSVNGFVTVFADKYEPYVYSWTGNGYELVENTFDESAWGNKLRDKLRTNTGRPRLFMTKQPRAYVEGDEQSWYHTGDSAVFEFEVSNGKNVTAELIIDNNGDSRFTNKADGDDVKYPTRGKDGVFTCTYVPDNKEFFGPLYWKLIVRDGDLSASTTGMFKIARDNKPKRDVDLLEIVPYLAASDNSTHSLYLCTECQQSRGILTGNHCNTSSGKYGNQALQQLGASGYNPSYEGGNAATYGGNVLNAEITVNKDLANDAKYRKTTYSYNGNNIGVHEHKFGIVKYYDNLYDPVVAVSGGVSTTGLDDWNTNWMDDVRDDYNVYMDIMTLEEYHQIVDTVNNEYNAIKTAKVGNVKVEDLSRADLEALENAYKDHREIYSEKAKTYKENYLTLKSIIDGNINDLSSAKVDKLVLFLAKCRYDRFTKTVDGKNVDTTVADFSESELDAVRTEVETKYATAHADLQKIIKDNLLDAGFEKLNAGYVQREYDYFINSNTPGSELAYYDVYSYTNGGSGDFYTKYNPKYKNWRDAKIIEQYLYKAYRWCQIRASVNYKLDYNEKTRNDKKYYGKINLKDTYNCISIGAIWHFAGQDMRADEDCEALLDYLDEGGSLFLFRDTLTAESNSTSRMTRMLGEAFGQNARHYKNDGARDVDVKYNQNPAVTLTYGGKSINLQGDNDSTTIDYKILYGDVPYESYRLVVTDYADANQYYLGNNVLFDGTVDGTLAGLDISYDNSWGNLSNVSVKRVAGENAARDVSIKISEHFTAGTNSKGKFYAFIIIDNDWSNKIELPLSGETGTGSFGNHTFQFLDTPVVTKGDAFDPDTDNGLGTQRYTITVVQADDQTKVVSSENVKIKVGDEEMSGNGTVSVFRKNYRTVNFDPHFSQTRDSSVYFYNRNNPDVNINPTAISRRTVVGEMQSGIDYDHDRGVGLHKYVIYVKDSEDNNQILHGGLDIRKEIRDGKHTTTDRAEQCNEGIVTMYPFLIGSQLKVTSTNPQGYALDIEDPNMTVYYTLSGGSPGASSSMMVADPKNGAENYFLYQYNSVTFTGAGRSLITGIGRNNNDERRLFINVILNAARPSVTGASLDIYDADSTLEKDNGLTNKIVKIDPLKKDDYVRSIESVEEMPDFSYIATVEEGDKLDRVKIYWDLNHDNDYEDGSDTTKGKDVLIFDSKPDDGSYELGVEESIGSGLLKVIDEETPYMLMGSSGGIVNVTLKPYDEYFNEGKAYIVVEAYTEKSESPVQKRIRIELKPERMHLN